MSRIEIDVEMPQEGEGYEFYVVEELKGLCDSLGCNVKSISMSGETIIRKEFERVTTDDVIDVEFTVISEKEVIE